MIGKPLEQYSLKVERLEVPKTQPTSRSERRKRSRSHVHWPVCFFGIGAGDTIETVTENLSSSGFLCFSPVPLIPGDLMTCVLRVPSHQSIPKDRASSLECRVRVVWIQRVEERQSFRVACHIEEYRFVDL